jgi:hypothetical protein
VLAWEVKMNGKEAFDNSLEKAFVEEYLDEQGYSLEKLRHLPERVVKQLMKEATRYASLKMEEIRARAQLVHEIHEGGSHHE